MHTTPIAAIPARDRPGIDPSFASSRRSERPVDRVAVAGAARDLLVALGADLDSEGMRETPRRMAAAYLELLRPKAFSMTTVPNDCAGRAGRGA
jgi:GTP cyclohydrolase IA